MAAIQSAVMSTSITIPTPTPAIQAANALYLCGFVLDLMSAFVSFLTARWLQLLLADERRLLEECFSERLEERINRNRRQKAELDIEASQMCEEKPQTIVGNTRFPKIPSLPIRFFASSLFSSFPMLIWGVASLLIGLTIYIWSTQPIVVAALVTLAYTGTLPFLLGIFLIGKKKKRRESIIITLSWKIGDW